MLYRSNNLEKLYKISDGIYSTASAQQQQQKTEQEIVYKKEGETQKERYEAHVRIIPMKKLRKKVEIKGRKVITPSGE